MFKCILSASEYHKSTIYRVTYKNVNWTTFANLLGAILSTLKILFNEISCIRILIYVLQYNNWQLVLELAAHYNEFVRELLVAGLGIRLPLRQYYIPWAHREPNFAYLFITPINIEVVMMGLQHVGEAGTTHPYTF